MDQPSIRQILVYFLCAARDEGINAIPLTKIFDAFAALSTEGEKSHCREYFLMGR